MHSPIYLAICAASLLTVLLFGYPDLQTMVIIAAIAIAVLGVPHGGLDHWTGRRLLQSRFASRWWMVFFPTYIMVGFLFAFGWYLLPSITVIIFFLFSAWHFGREDQLSGPNITSGSKATRVIDHLVSASVGGLVIWVPAVARPEEMRSLLGLIIPGDAGNASANIVAVAQLIAACLIPAAAINVFARLIESTRDCRRWVPLATALLATYAPILISFSVYFCVWHSCQGLMRLRREEALDVKQFIRNVLPLSTGAIVGLIAIGWWLQGSSTERLIDPRSMATLQATFIGLSAIAIPHLLLHECDSLLAPSRTRYQVNP